MKKTYVSLIIILSIFTCILFPSCCEHEWQDATCTEPQTCSLCGKTIGEATGHTYANATCTTPKTCIVCGATSGSKLGHNYVGSCGEYGVCSRCGIQSSSIISHNWKGNNNTGVLKCSKCGESITSSSIKGKSETKLTEQDRAFIYWHINNFLTMTTSSGKYYYTITEAFDKAASQFGLSAYYLRYTFWGAESSTNYKYYKKYYL